MLRKVDDANNYAILKIKLGTDRDEQIIRIVRDAAPDKVLRVDANTGWTPKRALKIIPILAKAGVDHIKVGSGKRGPITKAIQDEFFAIIDARRPA